MKRLLLALAACGGGSDKAPDAAIDAAPDALDKSATCAPSFGNKLTSAYGRLDGTIVAIVPPNDQACAEPNMTHLVVQVRMGGDVYRMVVDVLSNQGSPDVGFFELDAPLVGPAWTDGWHTGLSLDYPSQLMIHSTQFTPMVQADLVAKITGELDLGAKLSVFATSAGEPDSAHLVHRGSVKNQDGAIVIGPDTASPHWLVMKFDEDMF